MAWEIREDTLYFDIMYKGNCVLWIDTATDATFSYEIQPGTLAEAVTPCVFIRVMNVRKIDRGAE